jgi:hypothetical protein
MEIHHSVTLKRVTDAVSRRQIQLDDTGFCLHCGADADSVRACGGNLLTGAGVG